MTPDEKPDCDHGSPTSGYAAYVADLEIIRDKINSLRQPFLGNGDHRAMAIEAELWIAEQKLENAIRHAVND